MERFGETNENQPADGDLKAATQTLLRVFSKIANKSRTELPQETAVPDKTELSEVKLG